MEKNNPNIQSIDNIEVFINDASPQSQPHFKVTDHKEVMRAPVKRVERRVPPSYLGFAWFSLLCFFPVGIFAILKSKKVDEAIQKGNFRKAEEFAHTVKYLIGIAIGLGLIINCLALAFMLDHHA